MSAFSDFILEQTGTASDAFDIKVVVRRCFFYDFDGYPLRLWDGQGVLTTTMGVGGAVETPAGTLASNEWIGTIDGDGTNRHQSPAVSDQRDGISPRLEFTIPFIDAATYAALKADQDRARGRSITVYRAAFRPGEGIAPQTPIAFSYRLSMKGVSFSRMVSGEPGDERLVYSATVLARGAGEGRSLSPRGTYTDTSQRERARLLGVASDSGCSFVAANAQRTYRAGG
ncbi:hypothetical protein [Oceaniglobus trochenteri]|uniref:hypothetical protein n=1 Tax=Oceaniglobus trochenteri TaxID=2763260 RepID=UPI001CFFF49F|nr:hypothetical protein [Oceaniglobus trochenteri]